jgi:Transglycosylase SLT domain/SPOR domain
MRRSKAWKSVRVIAVLLGVLAAPSAGSAEPNQAGETVEQALCRLIDAAAAQHNLPAEFLTRLLFAESSFRPTVVSPAGAQGIAQFMPGTAHERGLADPFDPEQAIPASSAFLSELVQRFGNRGLAAAAYNAGPARVASWLAGAGGLPFETQDYVMRITGRSADDWATDLRRQGPPAPPTAGLSCSVVAENLRAPLPDISPIAIAAFAPWGVQLAGNFSKSLALASFERTRSRYATVLADAQPMVIGTRLRTRGFSAFYRVRVPAQTRAEANALCTRIRQARGSCAVLRS